MVDLVLIESDWNLKLVDVLKHSAQRRWGINRIRLEFKDPWTLQASDSLPVLIESDWNLKLPF